jgi:hypothetical protein
VKGLKTWCVDHILTAFVEGRRLALAHRVS